MTSRSRSLPLATLATVAAFVAVPLGAQQASAAPSLRVPTVVGVDAVVEVEPLGSMVTAVVLEYDQVVHGHRTPLDDSAFGVTATLDGQSAARTVSDAYVSDSPTGDTRARDGEGRYVVVELDDDDANASATFWDGTLTQPYDLEDAYDVQVREDLRSRSGRLVVPATDGAVDVDEVLQPVVDSFAHETFTGTSGVTLPYGLHSPDRPSGQERYPLVVALHGSGERGTNGMTQLMANQLATAFAEPSRQQADPSFVLAPQAPPPSIQPVPDGLSVWEVPEVQSALMELIRTTMATYPVDPDRVYLTGLSMGSMGTFDILPRYPDLFAAALPVTGYADLDSAPVIKDIPIWATHSVDDATVLFDRADSDWHLMDAIEATGTPVVRDEWAANLSDAENEARALAQWREAEAEGSHTLFTAWTAGTTPVNPHFAWVPTYSNDVMIDWLFSHVRGE